MSSSIAALPVDESADEALLESLFSRLKPSPASLLKAALRFASHHPAKLSPQLLVSALQARGHQQAASWLVKLEPSIGVQEVMLQIGMSKSGVHKAKVQNHLLALRLAGRNADRFPLFQFKEGEVREWVPKLLAVLGNGLGAAHFLAVPRKHLENRCYLDLLAEGDDRNIITDLLEYAYRIADEAGDPAAATPGSTHT